ncbi:hypothetical protein EVAR_87259_1 [Eumeta japonica]|uniref:Uncharacterized protein n=1 Tax=Eumeta variegata TaxID=151549 RepID=A0A4C1YPP9_EUMVA|nr:hypothetical protein EVAR_87259_1 [Eumeta japonica]
MIDGNAKVIEKRHRVGGERRARGGARTNPASPRLAKSRRTSSLSFTIHGGGGRRRDKRASARRAPPRTAFRLFSLKRRERGAAGPARAGEKINNAVIGISICARLSARGVALPRD